MSSSPTEILALLDKLRYDLTAAQAKITDLKTMVASLPIERERPKWRCEVCGVGRPTEAKLRDHVLLIHDPDPVVRKKEAA